LDTVLEIDDLTVAYGEGNSRNAVVSDMNLTLRPGQVLGLIGESGCGKTTTALQILGYSPRGLSIEKGRILLNGRDVRSLSCAEVAGMRGRDVAYVPQNPGMSLNPARRVGSLIVEFLRRHRRELSREEARAEARSLLAKVDLPTDDEFLDRYPHQLSGGQQQRVVISIAIACNPPVVVMDEPTTGLDVSTQKSVLQLLCRLRDETGMAFLYVTHDLHVLQEIASDVMVMKGGRTVEEGPIDEVFERPRHSYTRSLLGNTPDVRRPRSDGEVARRAGDARPLLEVSDLELEYNTTSIIGLQRSAGKRALSDISFRVAEGEIVSLVGESGSGKSSIVKSIIGLARPTGGRILFDGNVLDADVRARTPAQRRDIGLVFQNPDMSLNPRRRVGAILTEALRSFEAIGSAAARTRAAETLGDVRLPVSFLDRFPTELSGGQRQRVAIARALIAKPRLLLCDEILTALDVSVQAGILDLLFHLRKERGLAILFISHDLGVVRSFSDRIGILYGGRIMAQGETESLFREPLHPYAHRLLEALPGAPVVEPVADPSGPLGIPAELDARGLCPFVGACPVARPNVCDRSPAPAQTIAGAVLHCHRTPSELSQRLHLSRA
jgi:oligopeptide/dipeptide ABC transporter ATP-binding protein